MRQLSNEPSRNLHGISVVVAIALITLLVTTAWAGTGKAAPDFYDLAFVIEHDGELVGEPRMLVPAGEVAEIRVASDDTDAGYRLTVVARPASTPDGRPAVDVATELFAREASSGWQSVAEPRVVAEHGKAASLSIGEVGGRPGLSVELTAEPISRETLEQQRQEMVAALEE